MQPCDGLEPVEALREVVVGDNQVEFDRPGRQLQRFVPICGNDSAMTFGIEKQLQHFEHFRIVFVGERGDCAMPRTYREVAIDEMLQTVEEAMS